MVAGPTEREPLPVVAQRLEEADIPGYIWDDRWRLVWVSGALKLLLGENDDERLGIGEHLLKVRTLSPWEVLTASAARGWLVEHLSLMIDEAGGPTCTREPVVGAERRVGDRGSRCGRRHGGGTPGALAQVANPSTIRGW